MHGTKPFLSVHPNPVNGNINFSLDNYTGTLSLTLTDLNGKIVHNEKITADINIDNYKINIQNRLAPGMYILEWKGKNFRGSSKILIQ